MNDDFLSQNLSDYTAEDRAKMEAIFAEEKEKTKAMLNRAPEPAAILIGGVGAPDGLFGAVGE